MTLAAPLASCRKRCRHCSNQAVAAAVSGPKALQPVTLISGILGNSLLACISCTDGISHCNCPIEPFQTFLPPARVGETMDENRPADQDQSQMFGY